MLFKHLEEELDLPAVTIYPPDSSRSESEVVCQKLDFLLILFVPDDHPAEQSRILEAGFGAGKADDLVPKDVGVLRYSVALNDLISGVIFKTGDKEDALASPSPEEFKVAVGAVYGDDASGGQGEMSRCGNIGSLAVGNDGEIRQIAIVVEKHMELNTALGLAEVSPGEKAQAEVDSSGIEAQELVLETEFPLFARSLLMAKVSQMKEGLLIELPGTVRIRVGKRALGGGGAHPQMVEFPASYCQTSTDLTKALRLSQLTEQHCYILVPGGKTLGVPLRPRFMYHEQKTVPRYDLNYLTEQTCAKLHRGDSFDVFGGWSSFHHFTSRSLLATIANCYFRKPILDKHAKTLKLTSTKS